MSPLSSMCRSLRFICVPISRYVCMDRVIMSNVCVSRFLQRSAEPKKHHKPSAAILVLPEARPDTDKTQAGSLRSQLSQDVL